MSERVMERPFVLTLKCLYVHGSEIMQVCAVV